jgi:ribosomal protein S18 acetylase RimI-like enzyme
MNGSLNLQSEITIRPATIRDAADLGALYSECFTTLLRFAYGLPPNASGAVLSELYAAKVIPLTNAHLAFLGDELAGFAVLRLAEPIPNPEATAYWRVLRGRLGLLRSIRAFVGSFIVAVVFSGRKPDPKMAYLDALGVAEKQRGMGIGTALLEKCFQLSRERGCTEIALHVLKKNDGARRLYEKAGFVARPDERLLPKILAVFVPGSRAYLMVKEISGE